MRSDKQFWPNSGLFHREFERRLVRLDRAILKVFLEHKDADLFSALFSVFDYLFSGRSVFLKSNSNYDL